MTLNTKLIQDAGKTDVNSGRKKTIMYSLAAILAFAPSPVSQAGDTEKDYCCKSTYSDCVACCPSSAPYYASGAKQCYATLDDCMKASKTNPGMCYPCTGNPCPIETPNPPKEKVAPEKP